MRLEELFQEGINDPHIFKAVIMAGGPGSGKTFVARKMLDGTGLKTVNSDIAFEFLMNKENLRKDMPPEEKEKRDQARDQAKELSGKQEDLYIKGRLGLIIDGTGKNLDKIEKINKRLKGLGYETKMLFVNSDLETSLQRNQDRFDKEGGRRVDPEIAKAGWNQVQKNMMMYQQVFGAKDFYIIDNSDGQEDDTKKENFLFAWKELRRWLNTQTTTPTAQQWKQDNKPSRQIGQRDKEDTMPFAKDGMDSISSRSAFDLRQAAEFGGQAVKAKKQSKAY